MRETILKFIESSKNSYELADRICELMEKEDRRWQQIFSEVIDHNEELAIAIKHLRMDSLYLTPTSPEDSRRDVGKGK